MRNSIDSGRPSSEVWKYDRKLDGWHQLSDMLTPRSELGLVLIDGYIYACGGSNGDVRLNTIERYSIAENKWTSVCIRTKSRPKYEFDHLDRYDAGWNDKSSLLHIGWLFVHNW